MRLSDSTLEQLNAQADLVAMIGRHTVLKPAGREFKGCCPFHGEKTPSFYINPESNLYYCFGCGAKGNALRFLMDYERLTFKEALQSLSEQTGIELPKEDNSKISYQRRRTPTPSANSNTVATASAPTEHISSNNKPSANKPSDNKPNDKPTTPVAPSPDTLPDDTPLNMDDVDRAYAQIDYEHTDSGSHHLDHGLYHDVGTYYDADAVSYDMDAAIYDLYAPEQNNYPNTAAIDGVSLPWALANDMSSTWQLADNEEGDLYQLLSAVNAFYRAMLKAHPAALQYLLARGISQQMIDTFELGFAPSAWQHLAHAFPDDVEGLRILGLIRTSQKGRSFDLLRERIIFPIKDRQGRIVGFAGRGMHDDVTPKYLNSSDSVVFQKQHILYGYHESRQAGAKDWLLVEGYMDVIALYQAGIYGAVAPMGTAVNSGQIATLLKFNDSLTLCFDGDAAGQKAALRTLDVAMPVLPDGKQLKFLTLEDNHDPDSYLQTHGADAMRTAITRAMPISDYLYRVITEKYELSRPEHKAAAMADIKAITEKLPKGSSFRWWLNSDLYQRLRGNRNNHLGNKTAVYYQDVDSDRVIDELLLCLLYQPSLIGDGDDINAPLDTLYQTSGADTAHNPFSARLSEHQLHVPALPTWQELHPELFEMVSEISNITKLLDLEVTDVAQIDHRAHFMLAALGDGTRQRQLAAHWHGFFVQTNAQMTNTKNTQDAHTDTHLCNNSHLAMLFQELLCQLIIQYIQKVLSTSPHLLISQVHKRRLLALDTWNKQVLKPAIEKAQRS